MIIRVEAYIGTFDNVPYYNIYQVGGRPTGKNNPYKNDKIKEIIIEKLDYTVAAFIYYESGNMEYTEDIKRYYDTNSGQGEAPEDL